MNITISQKSFSYKPGYDFRVNGHHYEAAESSWSLLGKTIVRDETKQQVVSMARMFSLNLTKYKVLFSDGTGAVFQMHVNVYPVYELYWQSRIYRVVGHKGLDYSIFDETCQVGAFTKNSVSLGKGDEYALRINDDEGPLVHVCLCIMVDLISKNGASRNLGINCDLGYMGPEFCEFDEDWEPKTAHDV